MNSTVRGLVVFAVLFLSLISSGAAQSRERLPTGTAMRQPTNVQLELPSPTVEQVKALALERAREKGIQATDVMVLIAGSSVVAVAVPPDVPQLQSPSPVARGYAAPQPTQAGIVLLVTNGDLQGAKVHTLSLQGTANGQANLRVANERGTVYRTLPVAAASLRGPAAAADMSTWRQTGSSTDHCAEAKRKFWCRLGEILLDILLDVGKDVIRKEFGLQIGVAP